MDDDRKDRLRKALQRQNPPTETSQETAAQWTRQLLKPFEPGWRVLIYFDDPILNIDESVYTWDQAATIINHYVTSETVDTIRDIHISTQL